MIVKGSMNYTTSGRKRKRSSGTVTRKQVFSPYIPGNSNPTYQAYLKQKESIKSIDIDPIAVSEEQIRYEGEFAEREAAAQAEIERKKMRTAPAYSKGAYQYISELDLPYLGRKI
jgi:hypothetical protein